MTNVSQMSSRVVALLAYAALAVLLVQPDLAFAQFEKGTKAIESIQKWIWLIIPILGLVAGGIVGLLYSFDVIRKETAYQWVTGIIFAGAITGGIIKVAF